jgi:hypothetical protein
VDAPLWVTLLVGLAAGVAGTLVSTTLQISHERTRELRSRMLAAADEFVVTGERAAFASDNAGLTASNAANEKFQALADELSTKHSRIKLLFGPDSQAAKESKSVLDDVSHLSPDAALHALDRFCDVAIDQLRGDTTRRFRRKPKKPRL